MATQKQLLDQVDRLGNIIRCILIKKAFHAEDRRPHLYVWRQIHGNLLDVAVVEWCKIFGNDKEPTHWKRVLPDAGAFRKALLDYLVVDGDTWSEYWRQMKRYRNSQVAHFSRDSRVTHYPSLDLALRSSYFYYRYVIAALRDRGERRFADDVEDYGDRFYRQAREIGRLAFGATAALEERVF